MSETHNNFENVGVANTGEMSGTVTGTANQINLNESLQSVLNAFADFKQLVAHDQTLTPVQREDILAASNDLEAEAKKPEGSWIMPKVRNGIALLKTLVSGAQAVHSGYEVLHPLIAAHFHLLS